MTTPGVIAMKFQVNLEAMKELHKEFGLPVEKCVDACVEAFRRDLEEKLRTYLALEKK